MKELNYCHKKTLPLDRRAGSGRFIPGKVFTKMCVILASLILDMMATLQRMMAWLGGSIIERRVGSRKEIFRRLRDNKMI